MDKVSSIVDRIVMAYNDAPDFPKWRVTMVNPSSTRIATVVGPGNPEWRSLKDGKKAKIEKAGKAYASKIDKAVKPYGLSVGESYSHISLSGVTYTVYIDFRFEQDYDAGDLRRSVEKAVK
jgi:hypothetical protein